ncbi:C-type lectin domain family 4 member K-like isoform 5-T5 [Salvelinus alpinus]
MSGEIIYSDVTFTRHQNQDTGAESEASNGRDPGNSDPAPPVGSKATIPDGGSGRVPVATLVCLCVLLLGLAITLGVLYASNMTSLQAEGARFAQMKENLTGKLHDLQDSYKRLQNETHIITVQRELLSSELQDCNANLTRVKDLLATIQGIQKRCNTSQLCSPGWEFHNGSCYYFSKDKLTWEQSQYACIHDGGHLVIIESRQEQEFIIEKFVRSTDLGNSPWIGLTDKKQEGVWVWMDNTTLDDSIKFWDPNTETFSTRPEPNDWDPGEDCARMGQSCSSRIKCWFDFACDQPCRRICESRALCERPAATS